MADGVSVSFAAPSGDELSFEWELETLRGFDPDATDPPAWRLGGEIDWDEVELARVLSARFEDGRLLAVAAVRPAGADGHGEEGIAGVIVDPEGTVEELDEVLLSTERDDGGGLRRIGLELYRPQMAMPLRVAGEATGSGDHIDGRVRHEHAALELRGQGAGVGVLDVLRPA